MWKLKSCKDFSFPTSAECLKFLVYTGLEHFHGMLDGFGDNFSLKFSENVNFLFFRKILNLLY